MTSASQQCPPVPLALHRATIQLNKAKPRPRPELVFMILVPDRDVVHLYTRGETTRMRYCGPVLPHELYDLLDSIPALAIIALAGNHAADRISSSLLAHQDLYVIPDPWLRHLRQHDLDARARTAARLVHAHLLDPIQLRLAPDLDDVPF